MQQMTVPHYVYGTVNMLNDALGHALGMPSDWTMPESDPKVDEPIEMYFSFQEARGFSYVVVQVSLQIGSDPKSRFILVTHLLFHGYVEGEESKRLFELVRSEGAVVRPGPKGPTSRIFELHGGQIFTLLGKNKR